MGADGLDVHPHRAAVQGAQGQGTAVAEIELPLRQAGEEGLAVLRPVQSGQGRETPVLRRRQGQQPVGLVPGGQALCAV